MLQYEAIFHGQTSATQKLAAKAAWITSLSLDETEIEEPDKVAKFTAACTRLATVTDELDLYITDSLNRFNYEVLQNTSEDALTLATASGQMWKHKKQKDLELVKNLKKVSSWNKIFEGQDKNQLIQIVELQYADNRQFRLSVDNAASQRMAYITELALKDKLSTLAPADEMLKKFRTYVIEECAGVIALRLRKYSNAFYLAKLNQATAIIATTTFTLRPGDNEAETNSILKEINQTLLTFHTPSQYKPIAKSSPPTRKLTKLRHASPPALELSSTASSSNDGSKKAAFEAFFDSKQIPLETKVKFLASLAGSNFAAEAALANAKDFDDVPSFEENTAVLTKQGTSAPPPLAPQSLGYH